MTWEYEVKSKRFYRDGVFQFEADYAGAPGYKNDSAFECLQNKGPLPRGKYYIGRPYNSRNTGLYTLSLTPDNSNNMCGRDAFKIHGDSRRHPGEASEGCIVIQIRYRKKIWESGDKELIVK